MIRRRSKQPAFAARRGRHAAACGALLLGAALLLAGALAGCRATEGDDGSFDPLSTTNANFTLPPETVAVGNEPINMAVTTTGGIPDTLDLIAVVNRVGNPPLNGAGDPNPGTVTILRNTAGTIAEIASLDVGIFPIRAQWANLDGGATELDLIVADEDGKRIAVFVDSGAGWPATPTATFALPGYPAQVSVVDLNGDGFDDILITVPFEDLLIALQNDGAGNLTRVDTTIADHGGRFAFGDFDGDANLDVVVLVPVAGLSKAFFYEWDGAGPGFVAGPGSTSFSVPDVPVKIIAGNFDADPDTELALLSETSAEDTNVVSRYDNNGSGSFSKVSTTTVLERATDLLPLGTVVGGDPGPGLAVIHTNQRFISVLRPSGSGFSVTTPGTSRNPVDVTSGYVTADGELDVITIEDERRAVGILEGDGAGGFSRTVIGFLSVPRSPHVVDVAGNGGALDLILVQPYLDRLVVLKNVAP